MTSYPTLMKVENLTVSFDTLRGRVRAVDSASFYLKPGKVLGIVGESGSGKSITGLALMGLLPTNAVIESGSILYNGRDLLKLPERQMRAVRGRDIAMIFQDPMSGLNPCYTVEFQLQEAVRAAENLRGHGLRARCLELLAQVGIPDPESRLASYPHELSGGMSQRVMIAMALASRPRLLIADEPTTALDVTIQAQILQLLRDLQNQLGMAMILITHDMGVVAQQAHDIMVMYAGQIMEVGETDDIIFASSHPYTQALLESMPGMQTEASFRSQLPSIPGMVPDLTRRPSGCQFHPRCRHVAANCREILPPLMERKNRRVRCHHPI